jgi:hypothetical protein
MGDKVYMGDRPSCGDNFCTADDEIIIPLFSTWTYTWATSSGGRFRSTSGCATGVSAGRTFTGDGAHCPGTACESR